MQQKPSFRTPTSAARDEIKDRFEKCKKEEEKWLNQTATPKEIAERSLFDEPRLSLADARFNDPVVGKRSYAELVEQLKEGADPLAWYRLGLWLKAENIRDPLKFFPKGVLTCIKQYMKISGAGIRNVAIVKIWLPYTEPLVRTAKWLREAGISDVLKQLELLGYDSKMLELFVDRKGKVKNWMSSVEFTCEWVAKHTTKELQKETLVNSYSRFRDRLRPQCSFCPITAEGEFWVRGEPIPYCPRHRPDRLPESAANAWPDHTARGWWRDGLEIRPTIPSLK